MRVTTIQVACVQGYLRVWTRLFLPTVGHTRCMDSWEVERAVERGVRRANGEDVSDDGCCGCLAVPGCLLIFGFMLFVIVQSGMPWEW